MKDLIRNLILSCLSTIKLYINSHSKQNKCSILQAEIIRNVHSIEKGLCIRNPRLGFGYKKIKTMLKCIDDYLKCKYDKKRPELLMAVSTLESYIQFHKDKGCVSPQIKEIEFDLKNLKEKLTLSNVNSIYGGFINSGVITRFPNINEVNFLELLKTRHSIRNFSNKPVNEDDLNLAIDLANRCPSACNRQTTRVYIVDKSNIGILKEWLNGIGGFVDSVDKFLMITGKTSAFNDGEIYQHIVNASIFTGYLTLSLTALNIGNCVIMRPLLYSRKWIKFAKQNQIPTDENLVCMMAIGNYKEDFEVPASYRIPVENLVKTL